VDKNCGTFFSTGSRKSLLTGDSSAYGQYSQNRRRGEKRFQVDSTVLFLDLCSRCDEAGSEILFGWLGQRRKSA